MENGVQLEYPGQFQVLYYDEERRLRGTTSRWEGKGNLPMGENSRITVVPMSPEVQTITGNGNILAKAEIPVELTTTARQEISMVTGVELGQKKKPDPGRPSLILRRAGSSSLWDIAKAAGSTMEAIRRANGLAGEPSPEQMLLIPVP